MISRYVFWAAVLIGLLIAAVYFVGLATDAKTLGAAINQLVLSLQGRTSSGNFAAYPAGTTTLQKGL